MCSLTYSHNTIPEAAHESSLPFIPQSKKVYSAVYSITNPCPIFKFSISMHFFCFMRRQNFDGSSKAPKAHTVLLILTAVNSLGVFHSYKLRALLTASLTMAGFHPSKLYKSSNVSSHATYCISLYLVLPRSIMHSFFFFDTYIYGTLCAWTACTLFTYIVCFSGLIFSWIAKF